MEKCIVEAVKIKTFYQLVLVILRIELVLVILTFVIVIEYFYKILIIQCGAKQWTFHGGPNWAKNENSLKTLKSGFILCETSFLVNINTFPICDNLKKFFWKIEKNFEQKSFVELGTNPAPLGWRADGFATAPQRTVIKYL